MYKLDFNSSIPLFEQIEQKTKLAIATGEFPEGKLIPSVRDIARAAAINHQTVVKAYRDLRMEGVIVTVRGMGFSVAIGARRLCERYRRGLFEKKRVEVLNNGTYGGLSPDEMRDIFESTLDKVVKKNPVQVEAPQSGRERQAFLREQRKNLRQQRKKLRVS